MGWRGDQHLHAKLRCTVHMEGGLDGEGYDVSSPHGGRGVIPHEVEVYGAQGGREKCHPPQN